MSTDNSKALALHLQNSAASKQLSLRERSQALARRAENNILLLDCSGSMGELINNEQSKIERLWQLVQSLRSQNVQFKICEFGSSPQWSDGISLPALRGSTALAEALDFIATVRPQQITIITDGYPDDPKLALVAATQLRAKINVLYVGPPNDYPAQDFCRQLAEANNGSYASNNICEVAATQQIETTARLMLTSGSSSGEAKKSTINL